jgi:uncharacterized repeat protein (TIGR03843 family)
VPVLRWAARTRGPHLPACERLQALSTPPEGDLEALETGEISLLGRIADASNAAFLATVAVGDDGGGGDAHKRLAIWKPVAGERPLWDFPDGTLAQREVAAHLISATGGWDIVPPTVLREGPLGLGSLQLWVGDPEVPAEYVVDVVAPDRVPTGWLPVLQGEGEDGRPVVVVHEDSPLVRSVAVFDAVLNNSDRKGSHLVRDGDRLRGFDHGVSLHSDDKLRTVFWGFAGQALEPVDTARLDRLALDLDDHDSAFVVQLSTLITRAEVAALTARVRALRAHPAYPRPSGEWPAIPWPPL